MTIAVEGLLDAAALAALRDAVRAARTGEASIRVLLRDGVEVDRACMDALRELGAEVVAESAYLARWLRGEGH